MADNEFVQVEQLDLHLKEQDISSKYSCLLLLSHKNSIPRFGKSIDKSLLVMSFIVNLVILVYHFQLNGK